MTTPRFEVGALLFDLDGLVVDSETIWQASEKKLMAIWGGVWTEEDAVASRGTGIPETVRRMQERAGRQQDPKDADALVEVFLELAAQMKEKPGARALAEAARAAGARTAIASSSPRRVVARVLEALDLIHLFDQIVTGDDVPKKKPDPAIFLLAAERVATMPKDALVLEDSMPGVLGAKNANMRVIAVPEVDAELFVGVADAVAKDLVEARAWIVFGSAG